MKVKYNQVHTKRGSVIEQTNGYLMMMEMKLEEITLIKSFFIRYLETLA